MKNITSKVISFLCIAVIVSCSKENVANRNNVSSSVVTNAITTCDLFAYPDTIFYPKKKSSTDYIVMPLNVQVGRYGSFPDVLKIDRNSGAVNISKSETGLKYIVYFIPKGTKDTCKKFLTISGINYKDSIFTTANNSSLSIPIYNANSQDSIMCKGGCVFGKDLALQGIAIDSSTGVIDLKQSILNGALGANPTNGTFKDFVMKYRIGDQSAKTLNSISFRLYYYRLKSQVPDSLKSILNIKESQVLLEDDENPNDNHIFAAFNNGITARGGTAETKCRPPYIIVTQK